MIETLKLRAALPLICISLLFPAAAETVFDFQKENPNAGLRPAETSCPSFPLKKPLTGEFTLSARIRLNQYPNGGIPAFTPSSPSGICTLLTGKPKGECALRILGKRIHLHFLTPENSAKGLIASADLPLDRWIYVTLVRENDALRLFLDGAEAASCEYPSSKAAFSRLTVGHDLAPERKFPGEIAEVRIAPAALSPEEVLRRYRETGLTPHTTVDWNFKPRQLAYPALHTTPDAIHPIAGTIGRTAEIVPWSTPGSRDLLVSGISGFFGYQLKLYRNLNRNADGLPLYDSGESIALAGRDFQTIHRPDGLFDLVGHGSGTPLSNQLLYYRNTGIAGKPEFGPPSVITVGGKSYTACAGKLSPRGWCLGDLDGDGVPDLIFSAVNRTDEAGYLPGGVPFWNGRESPYSGPGRGYDLQGKWLGLPSRFHFLWARGERLPDGLRFGQPEPLYSENAVAPLQWKCYAPAPCPALLKTDEQLQLVLYGDIDRLLALPVFRKQGKICCGPARNLLKDGRTMQDNYWLETLRTTDIDGDGDEELIAAGNPGRITVYRGRRPGEFEEVGSIRQQGGVVETDTLVTPARIDWDGDGFPDLICGDASGFLTLWPGTADPLSYRAGIHFTENGRPVHHQAGDNGSIQGYNEKRWGYLQPTVGDWDEDGKPEIITNDIRGELFLYRRGKRPEEVTSTPFTLRGKPFRAAWRVRPAILPSRFRFRGKALPVLLILDFNGDLAAAIPSGKGSTDFSEIIKFRDKSGNSIRLCGLRGHWGRAKLAVSDWNKDGKWDILWGTNYNVYREIWPKNREKPRGAIPCVLLNQGNNEAPQFDIFREIVKVDGERFDFRTHNCSLFPTDLDGDGDEDLIIGAEDGKVYYFYGKNLKLKD